MALIGIVAIAKNFAIGRGGRLPWHYPADLKFFKQTTVGNTVVMGANTWRSIGKPLPDRLNVVLTRSSDLQVPPDVMKLSSVDEVVELSRLLNKPVFVIGGAKVYESFADVIDRWIVTFVPDEITNADTFMPRDFLDEFEEVTSRKITDNLKVVEFLRR